jgi:L,D-transpeptidase catalytic domain
MAGFDKFANLSPHGWDKPTLTQTIKVGESAHIGLWGGGPSGEALDVFGDDDRICVPHEEPRPASPSYKDWRHFLLTGLKPGTIKLKAFLPGTSSEYSKAVTVVVAAAGSSKVKLVYFPGERDDGGVVLGTIYVIGGKGEAIPAAGGPRVAFKNAADGGHTGEPTPAGHYTLGPRKHVVTSSWWQSSIPWGAALRINAKGDVEFKDDEGRGNWVQATGINGVLTKALYGYKTRMKEKTTLWAVDAHLRDTLIDPASKTLKSATWLLNDFGRWGWQLLANGQGTAYFLHTTPLNENAYNSDHNSIADLANSHGCIHIDPHDRDDFIKKGYLNAGTEFEVRPYNESGPP